METKPQETGVKNTGAPPDAVSGQEKEKDERGVSWENRAKEYERKLEETRREMEELKARIPGNGTNGQDSRQEDSAEAKKNKILDFVNDPDAYIEQQVRLREAKRELPQAAQWLRSQDGFKSEDEQRIAAVIQEYGLIDPSPMVRAKAAWRILQGEKLEKELAAGRSGKAREESIMRASPDGTARTSPSKQQKSRKELLVMLRDAEQKGDFQESARVVDLLEDARE